MKYSDEKQLAIAAVQVDAWQLENYPEFQDDNDVVLAAVQNKGATIQFASARLKSDKKTVIAAIKNDPYILDFIDEKFRDDDDILDLCSGDWYGR